MSESDDGTQREPEPDWGLARRDPAAFFGLKDDHDNTDLKRAYNRLLRRYKPERAPEEFQIIRAAYEQLERCLRYGQQVVSDASAWTGNGEDEATAFEDRRQTDTTCPNVSVVDRLESGDLTLDAAYRELLLQGEKSPQDYFTMALLADVVIGVPAGSFFERLIEGLRDWPSDAGLLSLVRAYLASQAPLDELPRMLVACSRAVPDDTFYALTEAGWDRLLRERPFAEFLETIGRCEANLADDGVTISGKVAFYLHALSFALWEDESPWSQDALEFVETHFDQAPPHLAAHLDVLDLVREYVAVRKAFVADSPVCERMDGLMRCAFVGGPAEADREIVEFQLEALEDPAHIRAGFPIVSDDHQLPAYALWAYVVSDVAARNASPDEGDVDLQFWAAQLSTYLNQIMQARSFTGSVWGLVEGFSPLFKIGVIVAVGVIGFLVPFIFCLTLADAGETGVNRMAEIGLVVSAVVMAFAVVAAWRPVKRFTDARTLKARSWFARRVYRRLWRTRLFDFVETSHLDYSSMRTLLEHMVSPEHPRAGWLLHHAQRDVGMAVYGLAQHFRV